MVLLWPMTTTTTTESMTRMEHLQSLVKIIRTSCFVRFATVETNKLAVHIFLVALNLNDWLWIVLCSRYRLCMLI